MEIRIHAPVKTDTAYSMDVTVTAPGADPQVKTLGVKACNFSLPHLDLWDSFLPLMWVTRNGGPLYRKTEAPATIRADFRLHAEVVAFFAQRARDFGLEVDLAVDTFTRTYDIPTAGTTVLFGGGKDSRLLLGTLRELGEDPAVVGGGGRVNAADIPGALTFEPLTSAIPNRILPALMLAPQHAYHGSGIGEAHRTTPWQQYYDISSATAVRQTGDLLKRLGLDITLHVPQTVLPYNLVQMILARRYPDLFAGQRSVRPHKTADKNLHVTLLKRYHGLPHDDHCSDEMLSKMLDRFVRRSTDSPDDFGHRGHREIIEREMRAIIFRLAADGRLPLGATPPPPSGWDERWIDYLHLACNPDVDPRLVAIYREYADPWADGAKSLPPVLHNVG